MYLDASYWSNCWRMRKHLLKTPERCRNQTTGRQSHRGAAPGRQVTQLADRVITASVKELVGKEVILIGLRRSPEGHLVLGLVASKSPSAAVSTVCDNCAIGIALPSVASGAHGCRQPVRRRRKGPSTAADDRMRCERGHHRIAIDPAAANRQAIRSHAEVAPGPSKLNRMRSCAEVRVLPVRKRCISLARCDRGIALQLA